MSYQAGTPALDPYPSRVAAQPERIERIDPIVYKDPDHWGNAPLSVSRIATYEKDGFLFVENAFSEDEIGEFRSELDRLAESEEVGSLPNTITEPSSKSVRSIFAVHRLSPIFDRLSRDPRLLEVVRFLLDDDVSIHQSRINRKPGFHGKEFYWHSDFETWHVEDGMPRMRAISCSVALTDNTPHNGPLMLIPGSHKVYTSCVGKTPENHYEQSLRKQEYGVPDPVNLTRMAEAGGIAAPTGRAGSVVFFECNTMHGSNSNISPWPRSNVFLVYNSIENRLVDPFCGLEPRPDYIGSRDFTPLEPLEESRL